MYRRSPWRGCAFQLGVLWGESVPEPQADRAAKWYRTAIDYLPCYVKARVHLAEIYLEKGRMDDAKALLAPALESGDPEVSWRLADVAASRRGGWRSGAASRSCPLGIRGARGETPACVC